VSDAESPAETPAETPEAETPEVATTEPEAAPREPDPERDPLIAEITSALGDAVLDTVVARGDMWLRVRNEAWFATCRYLKDRGFTYFCFLSGIDWLPSAESATRYEQIYSPAEAAADTADADADADGAAEASPGIATGVAGGDTRFQVFARLYDIERKIGITLKADLDGDRPVVESIVPIFRGADWHEREAWEMFGFDFTGHPGLRHLYLPKEFEGFPMRKDFPLLARAVKPWPGLVDKEPVPGEDDDEAVEATP